MGGKGGRCVGLTILPPSCANCLEVWQPEPPGALRACPDLYRDCFTCCLQNRSGLGVSRMDCKRRLEKILCGVKEKFSRYRFGVSQRVGRGVAIHFHDRGTRRGEWAAARPGRTLPPGKTRHAFYRRLGRPQGLSGQVENLVPTGIRSRTLQPVVSRYTD